MSDRPFDHALSDWLETGTDRTPPAAIDAVLLAIKTTPQERDRRIPRRFMLMTGSMRLAAAIGAVAIAAGAIYVLAPRFGVGGPSPTPVSSPSPVPTPTAAPATTKLVDRGGEADYTLVVPSTWNAGIQPIGIYFSAPAPVNSAGMWEGKLVPGSSPSEYVINEGSTQFGEIDVRGRTVEELIESSNGFYRTLMSAEPSAERMVTIDGEPAALTEHSVSGPGLFWLDAVVIHGDRAYALAMAVPIGNEAALRTVFGEVLASIRWTD